MKKLSIVLLILVAVLCFAVYVQRHTVRIAVISDLHLQPEVEALALARFRQVLSERPDAILCAGDIAHVDCSTDSMRTDYKIWQRLVSLSSVPVYAVPGNHDHDYHGPCNYANWQLDSPVDRCAWKESVGAEYFYANIKGINIAGLDSQLELNRTLWPFHAGVRPAFDKADIIFYHRPMFTWDKGRKLCSDNYPRAIYLSGDCHNAFVTSWGNITEYSTPAFSGTWWPEVFPERIVNLGKEPQGIVPAGYLLLTKTPISKWRIERKEFH